MEFAKGGLKALYTLERHSQKVESHQVFPRPIVPEVVATVLMHYGVRTLVASGRDDSRSMPQSRYDCSKAHENAGTLAPDCLL